jgi:hypothetical protein
MIKLKKQQPKQEAAPVAVSLADRIKETCAEAEQYIEKRIEQLKDSDEGRSLPIDWLRLNIRATTRAGGCHCKCALALLEKDANGRR